MEYRRLGQSGLAVSAVGLGCNNFGLRIDSKASQQVVGAALDDGINLFDTSDIYGHGGAGAGTSEELLGAALGSRRNEAIIATKFGVGLDGLNGPDWDARGSRRYVRDAAEASLRRLGTNWIDLYQVHFPDLETPIQETLSALDDLVHEGKVRYLGSSNFTAAQIVEADWIAKTSGFERFISAQDHYNLLHRSPENEVIPWCGKLGLGFLPYYPLASGLLTGKYRRDEAAPAGSRLQDDSDGFLLAADWSAIAGLEDFAASRDLSMVDVAIGGLAAMPGVTSVIAGATSPEQVALNVGASQWKPSTEDLSRLSEITTGRQTSSVGQ
jgi:aryl-alcohol dehydrogenase-like predicted oxidoreductase